MKIYVQIPDTLALNTNSRVRVADVFVGTVRNIELKDWVPTLTLDIEPGIELPANATAKIGQSSILGTQHVELASPANPSPEPLRDGATIPVKNSSAFPTIERTLASVATVLRGGGIPNLEIIQTEVNNLLTGNADQIRAFLTNLDTFTDRLNQQREDLARAIESTNDLITYVASRNNTLDRLLVDLPPLMEYLAGARDRVSDAVIALGRFNKVTGESLSAAQADLQTNLAVLQRPLKQLGRGAPFFLDAMRLIVTNPVAGGRPDAQCDRQRVADGHRLLGHAACSRAVVGSGSGDDDSRRSVHPAPEHDRWWRTVRRARRVSGGETRC